MRKNDEKVEYVRLVGKERRFGGTLESVSDHWQGDRERFLFISPHDDDVVLGSGIFMQLAERENVDVHVLIVTDGSMGYCSEEEITEISKIRKAEAYESYASLNVRRENIIWLGYPDCELSRNMGRRRSERNDAITIEGYTGLENTFTYWLRRIRPTQCFLPTSRDFHPDHKIVHEEFLISLFHAAGAIWPELGAAIDSVPYVHEMGVYCDFSEAPKLRVAAPVSFLQKKLDAIAKFKSQRQIASLIEVVRGSGPCEYFRPIDFKLYQPSAYFERFEKKHHFLLGREF